MKNLLASRMFLIPGTLLNSDLNKTVTLDPNLVGLYYNLGNIYEFKRQYRQAFESYRKFVNEASQENYSQYTKDAKRRINELEK